MSSDENDYDSVLPKSTHGNASRGGESYPELHRTSNLHKAIIDFMIVHPQARAEEIAAKFEITKGYYYVLRNTDLFKAELEQRREEIVGPAIASITEKLAGLAEVGLDKMAEELENSGDKRFVQSATEMALKNLGYGAKAGGQVGVTVKAGDGAEVRVVSSSVVQQAAAKRKALSDVRAASKKGTEVDIEKVRADAAVGHGPVYTEGTTIDGEATDVTNSTDGDPSSSTPD